MWNFTGCSSRSNQRVSVLLYMCTYSWLVFNCFFCILLFSFSFLVFHVFLFWFLLIISPTLPFMLFTLCFIPTLYSNTLFHILTVVSIFSPSSAFTYRNNSLLAPHVSSLLLSAFLYFPPVSLTHPFLSLKPSFLVLFIIRSFHSPLFFPSVLLLSPLSSSSIITVHWTFPFFPPSSLLTIPSDLLW